MKIMFICTGNICRSAMAHKMLESKIKELNKNIEVYSCGTYAENGDIPTEEAIDVLKKNYHIDLTGHRATNIYSSEIEKMDIILCATTAHKAKIINMYPMLKDKIFTIKEYAGYIEDINISDPWGCDYKTYVQCAAEINNCIDKIINKI